MWFIEEYGVQLYALITCICLLLTYRLRVIKPKWDIGIGWTISLFWPLCLCGVIITMVIVGTAIGLGKVAHITIIKES